MKILRPTDKGYERKLRLLDRRSAPSQSAEAPVRQICAAVADEGDRAVLRFTEKFGGPKLPASRLLVSGAEIELALASLAPRARKAILAARTNVREFARASLRKSWRTKNRQGAITGERFDPFPRVGIYVPGGTAPLVSTAVMTCTIAHAAGVPEIVAATPPGADGSVHPALLAALHLCGATEIYRAGGAQAVAALAFGTRSVRPVAKIFGPGNAYVVEAKRQLFGRVAVDLLPGPSEILVIADAQANPAWVAADLLAQAEHGRGSVSVLLTPSAAVVDAVAAEIATQLRALSRPDHLAEALAGSTLVQTRSMDEAVDLANRFACEHVSVATERPDEIAGRLVTSGAIFIGGLSPVAAGDFLAGPSHELPTGGAAKSFAGLTADQFQRRTSIVRLDETSLRKSLPHLETFAEIEGLDAHGRSASIRVGNRRK